MPIARSEVIAGQVFGACADADVRHQEKTMKTYLLAAIAALASHGMSTAKAGTWWVLDSNTVTCVPATVYASHDPAFASPFALAAKMRREGRLNRSIDQVRNGSGSTYGVYYDGMVTAYFVAKRGCELFISRARAGGDLP
jgi:hypothetical protein